MTAMPLNVHEFMETPFVFFQNYQDAPDNALMSRQF